MIFPRLAGTAPRGLGGLAALGAVLLVLLAPQAASAQGRLDAQYEASLSGIPIGKGSWTIDISDDQFSASAAGATTGLLKAFAGGSGTGASQGRVVAGALVPTNYNATTHVEKERSDPHRAVERHREGMRASSRCRRSIATGFR